MYYDVESFEGSSLEEVVRRFRTWLRFKSPNVKVISHSTVVVITHIRPLGVDSVFVITVVYETKG